MTRGTLRRAVALLEVDRRRAAQAVALGTLALGCAVALAAVAAWLIARASQMPPVLTLSVATVAVRAFGIGRGVLRYCERLVSHDVALRGMTTLRTTLYTRMSQGQPAALLTVRRGDLLTRIGADVDTVGDVVVRGVLPAAVAAVLGVLTVGAMALIFPPAGIALALCLLLAGVLAPVLAAAGAGRTQERAAEGRARATASALGILDDAGPLAVAGRTHAELAALAAADRDVAAATDAGAPASALAAGVGQLATGLAVLAALVTGVPAVTSGRLSAVALAVVVLTPLAAFEATSVLPAAAVQVQRSRAAAARILALLDAAGPALEPAAGPTHGSPSTAPDAPDASPARPQDAALVARDLQCGWPGRPPVVRGLDLHVEPGRSIAVVGPSGSGKTTLLVTLAGLLPRQGGSLSIDSTDLDLVDRAGGAVLHVAEDGHVFGTSILENLRVARGDVTPDQARAALGDVALTGWLAAQPDGLDTLLGPDGRTLSGGERRRLLLARGLLSPAPVLLVDEPAEHLDPGTADAVVRALLTRHRDRGVVVVTHRLTALDAADEVIRLEGGRVAARGTHAALLASDRRYREDLAEESREDA
ncbi:thiol reductant ABC exporter subunit CydC [Cellulomonas edaphi]|uniref:Thiol reductant ABC exporter subunit CydC n=1 Tax=Cellulomonas edaphi TaxID=3053468 RepID=A0ABT7S7V0_9CELL|nr:thiol reductant ABC exporter subunit CydC [Cellulomons edaphi]MDM7831685.1 thiol reductant ABC exporter subunit CydC [Cellulomons edaphi]